jgi:hypothetical protein
MNSYSINQAAFTDNFTRIMQNIEVFFDGLIIIPRGKNE